jgi:diguanylate cyclase (GGDEF)-like protein
MQNFSYTFSTVDELASMIESYELFNTKETLIQVFCGSAKRENVEEIQEYFSRTFPHAAILGTTTDGIIFEDSVICDESSNVATFTLFKHTKLKSKLFQKKEYKNDSYELGKAVGETLCGDNTKLILTFSDGINTNGEEYLNGINFISSTPAIAGGMAADNGKIVETFVFNGEGICSDGVVAAALSSDILYLSTNYTFNWLPIGKKMKVTKAVKNRVYEIDGINAVDIYTKYFGKRISDKLPQIGIEFPLIFQRDGVNIGRAPIGKFDDGSLLFAGNVAEGTDVRFGVGNMEEIIKSSHYSISKMAEQLRYKPEAIFIYSCMARRRFLDKYVSNELKLVKLLGPVSGFFTYGEFFYSKNHPQLLNETMTVVALSEDSIEPDFSLESFACNEEHFASNVQHAIAKLANVVSDELAELNENLEKKVQENVEYIYKQAYYDKLTSLPNRISLIKQLHQSLGKVIILLNIDGFAVINDFYGHLVGDRVLQKLAEILEGYVTSTGGELFKLPSDEFAIIKEIPYQYEAIERVLKEILHRVEDEDFAIGNHKTNITVTLSAALINKRGSGLVNADMALKNAKKSAKPYMIFQDDLEIIKEYEQNLKMANQIKSAITDDRIIPYYQPIFNLQSGKIEKYEALVRLVDDSGKIVSPYFFLEISQKIKLYPKITEIMIEKTFSYFAKNGLSFSLNLSFSDILNEKTYRFLFEKMQEYQIASQLTIEILETQEYSQDVIVQQFIEDIYGDGATIAIDDFGSGYANFEYLSSIKSDFIKIDGSLIKNIDTNKNSLLIVETIVEFAKKIDKKVVAEFVHNKEIYDIVKSLGIEYVQGYYLGEPKPDVL